MLIRTGTHCSTATGWLTETGFPTLRGRANRTTMTAMPIAARATLTAATGTPTAAAETPTATTRAVASWATAAVPDSAATG
jgi:hypothetical protein